MTDCPTMETLSEFIDGKLAHDAREGVVAHLGDCELCYSTLAESLAIREELGNRSRARLKKRLFYSIPAGLAAAAVMLFAFRILQNPAPEFTASSEQHAASRETVIERRPIPKKHIAAATPSYAKGLSSRLAGRVDAALLARRSAEERSKPAATFGFSSIVPPDKAAFRIGACLTDLELALQAKDREKIEAFAHKLNELLAPMRSSSRSIPVVSGDAGNGASPHEGFSSAVEALFVNKKEAAYVNFGSWVEATGFAAEVRDTAFFQPADIKRFRRELEKSGVPPGTLRNLSQFDSIISSGRIQTDEFKTVSHLLADIKEMF